jgi:hypothetical protein
MKKAWLRSWRHLIAIALLVGVIFFAYFGESNFFPRLWVSGKIFGQKVSYFVVFFFRDFASPEYLLGYISGFPNSGITVSTVDWSGFWADAWIWLKLLFTYGQFLNWLGNSADFLMTAARWLMFLGMMAVLFVVAFQSYFEESQAMWSRESKPLQGWYWFRDHPNKALWVWLRDYGRWLYHSFYFPMIATVLVFSLRLVSIAMDIVSEYFYFFASFNFISLFDVLFAAVGSFLAALYFVPPGIWVLVIYAVFRIIAYLDARRIIEGKLMPHDEQMVDSDTGVFTLILGKMRGGKSTLATAFGRIVNTIYHRNAFDNMNRVSLMFPEFPYMAFERDIVRLAGKRRIVNMQNAAAFAYRLYEKSLKNPRILYGYDVTKKRSIFYDGAVNISIADGLAIYAESYWIYFHGGNLIASNYPIRTDDLKMDKGHLVLWDTKFFRHKNKDLGLFSWLSHILVWDMLRFGKKVDPNCKFKDAAGPMVCVATEFGKEYGNMVTNSTYSANDNAANPKNDLLDYSLKLGGHLANIWHTNFFKFIADEQRSGSLSSNLVDVAQTIFTADPKNQKEKCALKMWWVEPAVLDWVINARDKFYQKYRYNREDQTLMFHFLNSIASFAYWRLTYVYNRFGYKEVILPNCTADSSGNLIEGEKEKFYIINYIDFAYRFESACMKDFLNATKNSAMRGFFDLPTYKTLMPSKEEWDMQGSYVVNDLEDPNKKFENRGAAKGRNGSRRQGGANRSGQSGGGAR